MKRRQFIAGLGAASAWPLTARAQPQALPVIGFLSSRSPSESEAVVAAFRAGLSDTGYVVGQNVAIEHRWAEGHYERLPALAAELVGLRVAVILSAGGPPAALAAKRATTTIPVVFSAADDPVGLGLVESLSRPGGNVTGMGLFNAALSAKRLGLLHELVPSAKLAHLVNPANPSAQSEVRDAQNAAMALGVELHVVKASTDQELEAVFESLVRLRIGGVVVAGEPFFDSRRAAIVGLAAKYAIPASYGWRENVTLGGLLSYGTSITDSYRASGVYCSRILKGERPADLPVMQPTKFHLAINLKTAKSLGLSIPLALLTGSDEVIE
ncbi:ABC transporter substrate-binding protein [Bradyrhizobium sp.]|uniref:ABC transporter substrate-binding protein n=1 Tax=Bradyrhizobium sp. TaxID=376 RepID=UPI003C71BE74